MYTVEVKDVSAGYRYKVIVKDVNLSLRGTGVFTVIGPNGSGKTTLLRVVAGVLKPYKGDVLINNVSIYRDNEVKKIIGYMPADIGLLPKLTLYENLRLFAELLGYSRDYLENRLEVLKKYIPVDDILYMKAGTMSTGQKVRAGLIRALIHDPKVLILDEPTRGLDAVFAKHVRALIQELARDRLVIMTTHLLHEVLELNSYVVVLRCGELVFKGNIGEFRRLLADKPVTLYVRTTTDVDEILKNLGIKFTKRALGDYIIRLPNLSTMPTLLRELSVSTNIVELREDLDELVKALYGG